MQAEIKGFYVYGGHLGRHLEYLDLPKGATLAHITMGFSMLDLVKKTTQNALVKILQGLDQISFFCHELLEFPCPSIILQLQNSAFFFLNILHDSLSSMPHSSVDVCPCSQVP